MTRTVERARSTRQRARRALGALDPWVPPLALMAVIFFFSGQSNLDSGLGTIDLIGRKMIHAGEYALLTFLWWRALRTTSAGRGTAIVAAVAVAVGYAITDELHQTFVDGRHGSPIDVAIDTAGAALAALALWRRG